MQIHEAAQSHRLVLSEPWALSQDVVENKKKGRINFLGKHTGAANLPLVPSVPKAPWMLSCGGTLRLPKISLTCALGCKADLQSCYNQLQLCFAQGDGFCCFGLLQ